MHSAASMPLQVPAGQEVQFKALGSSAQGSFQGSFEASSKGFL